MTDPSPRLAVRAILLHEDRLLVVNAWPDGQSDLWAAPGGGVSRGEALTETLRREVHEETGLVVAVGAPCLVNEFHDPESGYHQVEVFFRCRLVSGALSPDWRDPEGIVTQRRFVTRDALAGLRYKPDSLPEAAWGDARALYDPLEPICR